MQDQWHRLSSLRSPCQPTVGPVKKQLKILRDLDHVISPHYPQFRHFSLSKRTSCVNLIEHAATELPQKRHPSIHIRSQNKYFTAIFIYLGCFFTNWFNQNPTVATKENVHWHFCLRILNAAVTWWSFYPPLVCMFTALCAPLVIVPTCTTFKYSKDYYVLLKTDFRSLLHGRDGAVKYGTIVLGVGFH